MPLPYCPAGPSPEPCGKLWVAPSYRTRKSLEGPAPGHPSGRRQSQDLTPPHQAPELRSHRCPGHRFSTCPPSSLRWQEGRGSLGASLRRSPVLTTPNVSALRPQPGPEAPAPQTAPLQVRFSAYESGGDTHSAVRIQSGQVQNQMKLTQCLGMQTGGDMTTSEAGTRCLSLRRAFWGADEVLLFHLGAIPRGFTVVIYFTACVS